MKKLLILLCLLYAFSAIAAEDITQKWNGIWNITLENKASEVEQAPIKIEMCLSRTDIIKMSGLQMYEMLASASGKQPYGADESYDAKVDQGKVKIIKKDNNIIVDTKHPREGDCLLDVNYTENTISGLKTCKQAGKSIIVKMIGNKVAECQPKR